MIGMYSGRLTPKISLPVSADDDDQRRASISQTLRQKHPDFPTLVACALPGTGPPQTSNDLNCSISRAR
jgi:hypothetical protein